MVRLLVPLMVLCFVGACIVPAPSGSAPGAQGPSPARKAAVAASPPMDIRNGANLGDKVLIDRVVAMPGRFLPGESVKMAVFFKALDEIPVDYTIFVHIEDAERGERVGQVDHAPPKPTSEWKKDEIVRDEFAVYIPPNVNPKAVNVLLGLWDPRTDQRLILRNGDNVRSDGNNRILIAQIPLAQ